MAGISWCREWSVCCVRPPKHFEGISVFLTMAPENFKINSLGVFYLFSEFKAAFILLLHIEIVVFFYILCASLTCPWKSKFKNICFSRSLPSVFGRCSWESWLPHLPVQNRLLMSRQALLFAFCVPVSWRLPFFFFFSASWPVAERSPESLSVLSSGVEYFGKSTSGKTCLIEF